MFQGDRLINIAKTYLTGITVVVGLIFAVFDWLSDRAFMATKGLCHVGYGMNRPIRKCNVT